MPALCTEPRVWLLVVDKPALATLMGVLVAVAADAVWGGDDVAAAGAVHDSAGGGVEAVVE